VPSQLSAQSIASCAIGLALVLGAVGCGKDFVRVGGQGTAVSPYFSIETDAGELPGLHLDAAVAALVPSDAGITIAPCVQASDCDDHDACTGQEACVDGFCRLGGHPKCFDGDPCTTDRCDQPTATCVFETVIDGAPCDDGNLCDGQVCSGGVCLQGSRPVCASDANSCVEHACNPGTGLCERLVRPDGESCSDGDACNGPEVCSAGFCTRGAALACDDHNPCTTDACDHTFGCVNTALGDGSGCSDGDLCNGAEVCVGGVCTPGTAASCDDHNPCTTEACSPLTGACIRTPLANGVLCPDGHLCDGDTCNNGICVSGTPIVCATDNDNNPCTQNVCQEQTGTCAPSTAADGTSCSDGNVCNGAELCSAGRCVDGASLVCPATSGPCKTSCNPSTGCGEANVPDGTSCSDNHPCNGAETCQSGVCTAGPPTTCTSPQVCDDVTGRCGP
jgi:hypothetical protein